MKYQAKNRSKRLRKKLKVDEFQELGFDVAWSFKEDITGAGIDDFIDQFFAQVIEPKALGFAGEGDVLWHGFVCTKQSGCCTDEQRSAVENWLKENGAQAVSVGELYDFWWS